MQQPGLTGQVKEDVITRFWELGVRVAGGELAFEPVVLRRAEFLDAPAPWSYSVAGKTLTEELPAESLGFTLCGVAVIYRVADSGRIELHGDDGAITAVQGRRLGPELSQSVFRRDGRVRKLIVDIPSATLA